MDMLKYEVNKLKRGGGSPSNSASNSLARPSYAGVSVSDVRIPLMWKRKDHLNDSGDRRRFAVFCLARIGAQIYDSSLICPVDRYFLFVFRGKSLLELCVVFFHGQKFTC